MNSNCSFTGRKQLRTGISLLTVLLFFLMGPPASGVHAESGPVPRRLLALYKGSEKRTEEINELYELAQLALNNLGFVVEYRDAEKPLPPIFKDPEYRGVISYFITDQMHQARRYRQWLKRVIAAGKKVVILGSFGALSEPGRDPSPAALREAKAIFRSLGIENSFLFFPNRGARLEILAPEAYNFERTIRPGDLPGIAVTRAAGAGTKVLLRARQGKISSDIAILSPYGGYVQGGAIYFEDERNGLKQLFLNPYVFFSQALKAGELPRLDLNTVNGLRTAFIHVDGDGFSTISKIDRWHLCAELFLNRVLKKFNLPFSIALIAAEIDPRFMGSKENLRAARKIFRRPNTEAASHGFAHPFDWRTGKLELDSIPGYRFDPQREILGSVAFIRKEILPPWKDIRLFFWSGMCNPTEKQISLAESHGFLQLNGDAGRLWDELPSITDFAPPYAQTGRRFRINARISNEYEFTHRWHGPYDGYRQVIRSLKFTGGNPPQTPADIYFHLYSMEWPESWKALRTVLKWAEHQPWTFLYASQYAGMVKDFLRAKMSWRDSRTLLIRNAGFIRTVFLPAAPGILDLASSRNVLGFVREKGGLRVFLDSHNEHILRFGKSGNSRAAYLKQANVWVDSIQADRDTLTVFAMGFGKFRMKLAGLQPGQAYSVRFISFPYQGTTVRRSPEAVPYLRRAEVTASFSQKANRRGVLEWTGFGKNRTVIRIVPVSRAHYMLARLRNWIFLAVLLGLIALLLSGYRRSLQRERFGLGGNSDLADRGNGKYYAAKSLEEV